MSSLYKNLDKETINTIDSNDWNEIILQVYKKNNLKYKFRINSELVDIKDRFRILKHNNVAYIIKKTTIKKAKLELKNSKKVSNLVKDINIKGLKLCPVIPFYKIIGEDAYLISEYKGYTLQENLYSNNKKHMISLEIFSELVKQMISKGIVYRGFIPRNIIIYNHSIFMIDFEDVLIFDNETDVYCDLLYVTNLILNWQYFYKIDDLKKIIKSLNVNFKEKRSLLKYELKYKKILGMNVNNLIVRENIKNTVIESEKPLLYKNKNKYEVIPTDLVHLISDLFGSDFDVLFDLLSYKLRQKDEFSYYKFLKLFSNIIKTMNKNIQDLKYYFLIIISMFLENSLNNFDIFEIKTKNFRQELTKKIKNSKFNLANMIIDLDVKSSKKEFKEIIIKIMDKFFSCNSEDSLLIASNFSKIAETIIINQRK